VSANYYPIHHIRRLTHQRANLTMAIKLKYLHCVSKNDTGVAHCNFKPHQPILVIFGRDVAERARYRTVICYPTSLD